jgi:hypothetical protein
MQACKVERITVRPTEQNLATALNKQIRKDDHHKINVECHGMCQALSNFLLPLPSLIDSIHELLSQHLRNIFLHSFANLDDKETTMPNIS